MRRIAGSRAKRGLRNRIRTMSRRSHERPERDALPNVTVQVAEPVMNPVRQERTSTIHVRRDEMSETTTQQTRAAARAARAAATATEENIERVTDTLRTE